MHKHYGERSPNIPTFTNAILHGENSLFYSDIFYIRDIFFNDMRPPVDHGQEPFVYNGTSMNSNSYDFRGPELSKDNELLILGCSFTYGAGIDESSINLTWPHVLSNKTNKTFSNISRSGDSAAGQVIKAFAYFKKFGHPKTIVALFPSFERFLHIGNDKIIEESVTKEHKKQRKLLADKNLKNGIVDTKDGYSLDHNLSTDQTIHNYEYLKNTHASFSYFQPSLLKKPIRFEDCMPEDTIFLYNMQFILMLKQYCDSNGIKFIWSSWHQGTTDAIKSVKNIKDAYVDTTTHDNLIDVKMFNWEFVWDDSTGFFKDIYHESSSWLNGDYLEYNNDVIDCHSEYKNIKEFDLGLDRHYGLNQAHWGIHRHIHVGEIFAEELMRIENV